jgi:hypothetical protein
MEDEIVIPSTRDLERVELEGAEALDDAEDRCRGRGQGPRRVEEMAPDEEPTGMVGGDLPGRAAAHRPDARRTSGPGRTLVS